MSSFETFASASELSRGHETSLVGSLRRTETNKCSADSKIVWRPGQPAGDQDGEVERAREERARTPIVFHG